MTLGVFVRVLLLTLLGRHANGLIYRSKDYNANKPAGEARNIRKPSQLSYAYSGPSSTFSRGPLGGYDPSYAQSGSVVSSGLIFFVNSNDSNTDSSASQESGYHQVGSVSRYDPAQVSPQPPFQLKPDAKPVSQSKAGMWDTDSRKKGTGSEISTGAFLSSVVVPGYKPQQPSVSVYNPTQVTPRPPFQLNPNVKPVSQSKAGMWDIVSREKATGSAVSPAASSNEDVRNSKPQQPWYKPQQPSVSHYNPTQVSPQPPFQLKPDAKPVSQSKAGMWDIGSRAKAAGSEIPLGASPSGVITPSYKPQQPSILRYDPAQVSPQPPFQLKPGAKPMLQSKAGMWDIGSRARATGSAASLSDDVLGYKPQQSGVSRYNPAQVSPHARFQLKPDAKPVLQSKAGMWDIGSRAKATGSAASLSDDVLGYKPQQSGGVSRYNPAQVSPQPHFQLKPDAKPVLQSKAGMWDIGSSEIGTGSQISPRSSLRDVGSLRYKPQQSSSSSHNLTRVSPQQSSFQPKPDAKPASLSKARMWDLGSSSTGTGSETSPGASWGGVGAGSYNLQQPSNFAANRYGHGYAQSGN